MAFFAYTFTWNRVQTSLSCNTACLCFFCQNEILKTVLVEYLVNDTPYMKAKVMSWEVSSYSAVLLPVEVELAPLLFLTSVLTGRQVEIKMKYVTQVTNVPEKNVDCWLSWLWSVRKQCQYLTWNSPSFCSRYTSLSVKRLAQSKEAEANGRVLFAGWFLFWNRTKFAKMQRM